MIAQDLAGRINQAWAAHVAAHGPDCGKSAAGPRTVCHRLYGAWLHLADGDYRQSNSEVHRFRMGIYRERLRHARGYCIKPLHGGAAEAGCQEWRRERDYQVAA